ncbi:hypothetical protein D3P07_12170 [Paenibacillus sp. 1011MAR3C5]|uniref:hypothetical protein n=1 Tax=Paenibacillus sp. 1011MAR3C5 TaxID=1675787 RepID=UPI000E6D1D64|nr:hypothetical protein [Paenibacillus sp. 1011MAR3C5]RJE88736.1 hypothetical protein D3P07_12170 [Paenibacillus sp. 1011MAR3C5]
MTIIDKLATSLNRKDEGPNQELAQYIADIEDREAVRELMDHLTNKDKDIQSDCIKVLYEIGNRKPSLVAGYSKEFLTLLDHKNNRLVWGAMTALDAITLESPEVIYAALDQIVDRMDKGSVITKDHGVNILIKLCSVPSYADHAFTLLIEQLKRCPTNQLPMYAENAISIVNDTNKAPFIHTLFSRLDDIDKDTKRKRVVKVIKRLS